MNRIQLLLTESKQGEGEKHILTHPMLDDFVIEAVSDFSSYAELAPSIDSLTNLAVTFGTAGGGVGQGAFKLRQILDMQRWVKTSPVRIATQLFFYTKENAKKDVVEKINELWGLHLPQFDGNRVKVPGMNAQNVKKMEEAFDTGTKEEKELYRETFGEEGRVDREYNSLFSVIIPGVVYIPYAFLYTFTPTYSKHTTLNGYPLWATAEVVIQGISSAFHSNFTQGSKYYYNRKFDTITTGQEAEITRGLE